MSQIMETSRKYPEKKLDRRHLKGIVAIFPSSYWNRKNRPSFNMAVYNRYIARKLDMYGNRN